jgi:hypothetical protein
LIGLLSFFCRFCPFLRSAASADTVYTVSLEFALMVMVMGYGAVGPATDAERAVAVALMFGCGWVVSPTGLVSKSEAQYNSTLCKCGQFVQNLPCV